MQPLPAGLKTAALQTLIPARCRNNNKELQHDIDVVIDVETSITVHETTTKNYNLIFRLICIAIRPAETTTKNYNSRVDAWQ